MNDVESIPHQQSYPFHNNDDNEEIHLSDSQDIVEAKSAPATYRTYTTQQARMWAMQPPQPYIPHTSSEEEVPVNIGRAKIRSPNGGSTHFNVFLNQTPTSSHQQTPQQNYGAWQQQQRQQPQTMYNQSPQMYVQPGGYPSQAIYNSPPPHHCYGGMNGMMGGLTPQHPTVVYMNQPPPTTKREEDPVPSKDSSPPPPLPPKPTKGDLAPIAIASLIIAGIAFMMGILCLYKTNEAYNAYREYEEEGNGDQSFALFDAWQMSRNVALGAGASCVSIYSLAFLLIFWAGMQHKMKRKVVSGCCMTMFLIGAWIVFAFSFLVDVVVLVLAFDEDKVVYSEIVWAAFIGHTISWLGMLVNEEMARSYIAE